MNPFKEISNKNFSLNPFELKNKWMLITAGNEDKVNTMTASWGGFGILWNREVAFVVIRPQRYTREFVDRADSFSLTFFDKSYQKQMGYLGKVSGRDENKIEKSGLTVSYDKGVPYFEEAETVVFIEKLYRQPMAEDFFIKKNIVPEWFPEKDFHLLYIGEIKKVLTREQIG